MNDGSVYESVGGMPFFESLVGRFYEGVSSDPILLAVYPHPHDFTAPRHRLTLFLAQYWGGPETYNEERGHPRLRMRHAPFAIGPVERDRWLVHMRTALASLDPPEAISRALGEYFSMSAEALRNNE